MQIITHEQLTKYENRSSYYFHILVLSITMWAPNIPFLPIFKIIYLYLPLFRPFSLLALIWAYLPLIARILPYVPYSPYICILLLRLHPCAKFQSNGPLFMDILNLKQLGDTESVATNAVWVLIQSLTNLFCSF